MNNNCLPVCDPWGETPEIALLPAHRSEAEKRHSRRSRRRFMGRRAALRWLMRTFRLYRSSRG